MYYYAHIEEDEEGYLVSFPDLPSINTFGDTIEEALSNATEALNACLESDFQRGFSLPSLSSDKRNDFYSIQVLPHIEIAYTLRKLRKGRSQVEIASELGISYQAYQKLENPRKCNPTVKTLEKISAILGRNLEIKLA